MLYTYKELLKKYGNERRAYEAIEKNQYFQIARGYYRSDLNIIDETYIRKRYPHAILTGISAFAFYDLTDTIPSVFEVATSRNATRIKHKSIKQTFQSAKTIHLGKCLKNGVAIYDKERLLVELFRFKSRYPYDLFKEIVNNYRAINEQIDANKIAHYLKNFKNAKMLFRQIHEVVF